MLVGYISKNITNIRLCSIEAMLSLHISLNLTLCQCLFRTEDAITNAIPCLDNIQHKIICSGGVN